MGGMGGRESWSKHIAWPPDAKLASKPWRSSCRDGSFPVRALGQGAAAAAPLATGGSGRTHRRVEESDRPDRARIDGDVPFGRLLAVAEALDGRLDLDFRWRGEQLDRLVDERHATIVDQLVAIYRGSRWDVAVEATFSIYGERGSIDVFAWHPVREVIAVNEVKASVGEAGNTVVGVD